MSWVSYNSQKIIPSPHVSIEKIINRGNSGNVVGSELRITLNGRFVYTKGGLYSGSGYPDDDFTYQSLEDLLIKQQALRDLFADDYKWFEIQPDDEDTATPSKWITKVESIEFPSSPIDQTQWTHYADYSVVLSAQIGNADSDYDSLLDYNEEWTLEYQEDPLNTYLLTHTINCVSKEQYLVATAEIKDGWKKAFNYATTTLGGSGIDNSIVKSGSDPGFQLAVSFSGYNYTLNQTIDEQNGVYTLQETWLMSENDTYSTQIITVERQRDVPTAAADYVVTVNGQILGFRQTDGSGYSDALLEFTNIVQPSLYGTANGAIAGVTLRTTPVNTSITYNQIERTIEYTYVYDNSSTYGYNDQSITVSSNNDDCDKINVTVSGTVQGIKDGGNSAYDNAVILWSTVQASILSNANSAYSSFGGGGSLQGPHDKSITYNEYGGQISYSYSYHDWATDYIDDQTITVDYDKSRDHYTISVNGSVTAFCTAGYSAAETYFNTELTESKAYILANAYYNGDNTLNSKAQTKNISYNEYNRQISYNYSFNDFDGDADVDITFSVSERSDDCGFKSVTMNGNITGKKTATRTAWESANFVFNDSDYAGADPSLVSSYVNSAKLVSSSKNYNEFNNSISFSYEFLEGSTNYTIYETVTSNYSDNDCGNIIYTQSGTVKGFCTGGSSSALSNAESGYASISIPSGANYRLRKSETRDERSGTISYNIEYSSRSVPYEIDETITDRTSINEKGTTKIYSGTITGYCTQDGNVNVKYNNALTGYTSNKPTTPDGYIEVSNSVSYNHRQGTINYNVEYKEKSSCISGVNAINESITISDDLASDIFAVVPILGGNSVIQDKGGDNPLRRSVNIAIQVVPSVTCSLTSGKPSVATLLTSVTPSADVVLVERDVESWDPFTGSYSRNKSWIYQNC